jgi:hypothetical protein
MDFVDRLIAHLQRHDPLLTSINDIAYSSSGLNCSDNVAFDFYAK